MVTLNLYQDIMILTEGGYVEYIGSPLLEDDTDNDNQKIESSNDYKKKLMITFKEKIQIFKGDKEIINQVGDRLASAKKKTATDWLKFFASKLVYIVGKIIGKVFKFFAMLWKWIKDHVPGVQKISEKVNKLIFKNGKGEERGFTVDGEKISAKDLIGIGSTVFVLVGTLGYVAKKISANVGGKEESVIITTAPLTLLESDGDVSNSFTKSAPGILAKISDMIKNVKDAATAFFVRTLGMIIAVGIFILLLILAQPMICKALKFTLGIEAAGAQHILVGADKAKYVGAKLFASLANTLAKVGNMDIYSTCDCVKYNRDNKRYVYDPGHGCPSTNEILKQYKEKARTHEANNK